MSERVDKTKQYLSANNSISKQDKEYTLNFCKKTEYLEQLKQSLISELHEAVSSGYGDVNSKICFIFDSEESFILLKPALQECLEKFKIDLWSVYVTFVNKTKAEYSSKYGFLMHEVYAVSPRVLYVISETDESYNALNKTFAIAKVNHPAAKAFFLSPQLLCATEEKEKRKLWEMFKYLINYKD